MNARELAEKILQKMDNEEVAEVLHRESAAYQRDVIYVIMSPTERVNFTADDVVREIESMLGV